MNGLQTLRSDLEKEAFNVRAKVSMREFLRAKSWVEKVKSIERMNAMQRIAKAAMGRVLAKHS